MERLVYAWEQPFRPRSRHIQISGVKFKTSPTPPTKLITMIPIILFKCTRPYMENHGLKNCIKNIAQTLYEVLYSKDHLLSIVQSQIYWETLCYNVHTILFM